MTKTLVQRLREDADTWYPKDSGNSALVREAADEIERLRGLLGEYPDRAQLCHVGHEPIIHFSECPLCSSDEPSEHPAVHLLRQWLLASHDFDDVTWARQVRDLVEDGTMPTLKSGEHPAAAHYRSLERCICADGSAGECPVHR